MVVDVQVPEPADVVALSTEFAARLAELLSGLQELHQGLMKRDNVTQVRQQREGKTEREEGGDAGSETTRVGRGWQRGSSRGSAVAG